MGFDMNPQSLKKLCRELKLYSSCPELNEVLYLQQKGIVQIKNLDAYTGLRSLHLECNAISEIEGLENCVELVCLYLNQNLVEDIKGLDNLRRLDTINLSDNQIKEIKGLSSCPFLRQLNVSGNRIRTEEDVAHLSECKSLVSLDISNNKIDEEGALTVVRGLSLSLLRMTGNPIVSKTRYYRKTTITSMETLNYLDDSPVFPKERRLADAWLKGGIEGEKEMRDTIKLEEEAERVKHRKAFEEMLANTKAGILAKNEKAEDDGTNDSIVQRPTASDSIAEVKATDGGIRKAKTNDDSISVETKLTDSGVEVKSTDDSAHAMTACLLDNAKADSLAENEQVDVSEVEVDVTDQRTVSSEVTCDSIVEKEETDGGIGKFMTNDGSVLIDIEATTDGIVKMKTINANIRVEMEDTDSKSPEMELSNNIVVEMESTDISDSIVEEEAPNGDGIAKVTAIDDNILVEMEATDSKAPETKSAESLVVEMQSTNISDSIVGEEAPNGSGIAKTIDDSILVEMEAAVSRVLEIESIDTMVVEMKCSNISDSTVEEEAPDGGGNAKMKKIVEVEATDSIALARETDSTDSVVVEMKSTDIGDSIVKERADDDGMGEVETNDDGVVVDIKLTDDPIAKMKTIKDNISVKMETTDSKAFEVESIDESIVEMKSNDSSSREMTTSLLDNVEADIFAENQEANVNKLEIDATYHSMVESEAAINIVVEEEATNDSSILDLKKKNDNIVMKRNFDGRDEMNPVKDNIVVEMETTDSGDFENSINDSIIVEVKSTEDSTPEAKEIGYDVVAEMDALDKKAMEESKIVEKETTKRKTTFSGLMAKFLR